MTVEVIMPQMGESIAEGTITKWYKKVGEQVARDEPLFEISTDKVDTEIPSPSSGVLTEIKVEEGETVPVQTVVALIGSGEAEAAAEPVPSAEETVPVEWEAASREEEEAPAKSLETPLAPVGERVRSSPLVRRIAREHGIDLARVPGTGRGGRVTKADILSTLGKGAGEEEVTARAAEAEPVVEAGPVTEAASMPVAVVEPSVEPVVEAPERRPAPPAASLPPAPAAGSPREERVPMSVMRKSIAEHMVLSRRTSAHVSTVFEADVSRIVAIREGHRERFERQEGIKLTYTPFFIRAVIGGLKAHPLLNASIEGDEMVYKKDINIGIAVALEEGLIVPVIRRADEKSFLGLNRAVADLAERARTKKLLPEEVQGGTFTLTNPGPYGSLFGLPIINQPQVAILGLGGIHKRPVVVNDAIAIRSMVYLSLSFDHRLIDGVVADQFMAEVKRRLENWNEKIL